MVKAVDIECHYLTKGKMKGTMKETLKKIVKGNSIVLSEECLWKEIYDGDRKKKKKSKPFCELSFEDLKFFL